MTLILAFAIKAVMGLRVDIEDEDLGLDLAEHSETAYNLQ
jgi:ammonia channel protein AmtB